MKHSPERDAAAYLVGDLRPRARAALERHLLDCEECWHEVTSARQGRAIAEAARSSANPELRDRIRAVIATSPDNAAGAVSILDAPSLRPRRTQPVIRVALSIAASVVLLAAVLVGTQIRSDGPSSRQPAVISAALAAFSSNTLPGTKMVHGVVPDLTALGLNPVGAGNGDMADRNVDAFAYEGPAGTRVLIFTSAKEFPEAERAAPMHGAGSPWMAHDNELTILCARAEHSMLIIGSDDSLLTRVGEALHVMGPSGSTAE